MWIQYPTHQMDRQEFLFGRHESANGKYQCCNLLFNYRGIHLAPNCDRVPFPLSAFLPVENRVIKHTHTQNIQVDMFRIQQVPKSFSTIFVLVWPHTQLIFWYLFFVWMVGLCDLNRDFPTVPPTNNLAGNSDPESEGLGWLHHRIVFESKNLTGRRICLEPPTLGFGNLCWNSRCFLVRAQLWNENETKFRNVWGETGDIFHLCTRFPIKNNNLRELWVSFPTSSSFEAKNAKHEYTKSCLHLRKRKKIQAKSDLYRYRFSLVISP